MAKIQNLENKKYCQRYGAMGTLIDRIAKWYSHFEDGLSVSYKVK